MSTELLHRAGEALYGPLWQRELARALGVNERTMRRWAVGEYGPPPRVWSDVARLVFDRRATLADLLPRCVARSEALARLREAP